MDAHKTISDLGLSLNNGECLAIVKKERDILLNHIEQMKKDDETTFFAMKEKVNKAQAFSTLIERFEKYLGHED